MAVVARCLGEVPRLAPVDVSQVDLVTPPVCVRLPREPPLIRRNCRSPVERGIIRQHANDTAGAVAGDRHKGDLSRREALVLLVHRDDAGTRADAVGREQRHLVGFGTKTRPL